MPGCVRENKCAAPRQGDVVDREEKKKRGWVSNRFACMQDVHYKRCDRYLVASAIEGEGDYYVTKFMIGDSLVFDFAFSGRRKLCKTTLGRLVGLRCA